MIYCGIDGGGTKTKIVISKDNLIIGKAISGPSSIDTVSLEVSSQNIESGIREIYQKNLNLEHIDSIYAGLGGIASKKDIENVNQFLQMLPYIKKNAKINSGNDITNAFASSCSGRPNITVIIGTGIAAYGTDEEGNSHRASGIHPLEGDFGSGYDIGSRILKRMSTAFDGRIEHTKITKFLLKNNNINSFSDIVTFFSTYKTNRTFVAAMAKTVVEYAIKGDPLAIEVLMEGADEIAISVIAVDKKIKLQNHEIGIVGSLGSADIYFNYIVEAIRQYDSSYIVHRSELDPVEGSLLLSKKQLEK